MSMPEKTFLSEFFSISKRCQLEYVSSDDSDEEQPRNVHKLTWESSTLRGLKRKLDKRDDDTVNNAHDRRRRRMKTAVTVC